jgi:hypothetical protein
MRARARGADRHNYSRPVITRCSINSSGCRSRRWRLNRTPAFRFQPHVVAYVIRASCTPMSRVAPQLPATSGFAALHK